MQKLIANIFCRINFNLYYCLTFKNHFMELYQFATSFKGMLNPFVTEGSVVYRTNQPDQVAAEANKFIAENGFNLIATASHKVLRTVTVTINS